MALAASMQRAWTRVITFYKFLWNLRSIKHHPNDFASLFRRLVGLWKYLCSKWQNLYGKQRRPKPPTSNPGSKDGIDSGDQASEHLKEFDDTNVDQMVVPLDNISCSMNPYGTGVHDSARSSQMLNASRSSHNLGIISRSRTTSRSSHSVRSNDAQSPLGGGYTVTVQPTSPRRTYSMSSPELTQPRAVDIHEAILHHPRISQFFPAEPRSDSPVESIELFSGGEISSLRVRTPASEPPIEQCTEMPSRGAVGTSSQIRILSDEMEIPPLDHTRICAVAPENFQRYEKRRRIPNKATRVEMKPMAIDFSDRSDPPGWTLCTHPEGACYFYNAEKRIFTDVDLYDSAYFKRIVRHIGIIETFIATNHILIPAETDLVLDINLDANDTYVTDYYFANHQLRTIFFLDHFSSDLLRNWEEIKGVSSSRHLQYEMEAQYWCHCVAYPSALQLTNDLVCQLRGTVMHFIGDSITSPYATSPYTLDDLYKILSLADSLKENVGKPDGAYGGSSLLSRFMFVFSHMKFLHFYGQPEARLNRDHSIYGTRTNKRTWFIKTISLFLFSAPDVHLKILQKMWVDRTLHKAVWETSLKKVNDEWREFILYATVLLNANVAFLGKQSGDANRSPAQISSYCSITASIGSIILGLLLVRQNQTKNRDTADDAQRFLRTRAHSLFGLETLAIMFSLPYALLMWSMVSFLTAFLLMCLQDAGIVDRTIIGSLSGVIAVLIAWCIWTSWEKQPDSDAKEPEESLSFEQDDESEKISKKFTFEVVVPEPTEEPQPSAFPSFAWPAFLNRRRQSSYDSNRTVVEEDP
ncbi:hypothetical protein BYT27DRAFT_7205709 [Phlegmacium glaucopus]|nr:hypothetical protein BYT27DRAFT_7205709 [Phlegmacium glaucopus]